MIPWIRGSGTHEIAFHGLAVVSKFQSYTLVAYLVRGILFQRAGFSTFGNRFRDYSAGVRTN